MSDTPDNTTAQHSVCEILVMLCADLEADGVLSPDQRAALMDALARSPAMMELFESFGFARDRMARVFDDVLAAPVPERLLAIVHASAPSRTRPTGSLAGASMLARLGNLFRMPVFSPAIAIPAVLVSAAAGWLASDALRSNFVPLEDRGFLASAPLQKALELTPSGASASVVEGVTFKPTLTFASVQQTWCRQYELSYGAALRSGGLACRARDGVWRVIGLTEPEPPPATPPPGGIEIVGKEDVLDGIRAQVRGGNVLERDEVERLIKERWSTKP
jgi:surface antigen